MRRIGRFLCSRTLPAVPLALALLAAGCSRPIAVPDDNSAAPPNPSGMAFHQSGAKPENPGEELTIAGGKSAAPANHLPFQDREKLPAGTLISVRLKESISAQDLETSVPFEAVVVEPVVIEGTTLIPRGTWVSGRVESARTSKLKPNRGYVRLAMASVHLGGIDVPVQTARLFAQSPLSNASPSVVRLEKGKRLTFSLAEPVYLSSQRAQASH
jgi:hypothetical protein